MGKQGGPRPSPKPAEYLPKAVPQSVPASPTGAKGKAAKLVRVESDDAGRGLKTALDLDAERCLADGRRRSVSFNGEGAASSGRASSRASLVELSEDMHRIRGAEAKARASIFARRMAKMSELDGKLARSMGPCFAVSEAIHRCLGLRPPVQKGPLPTYVVSGAAAAASDADQWSEMKAAVVNKLFLRAGHVVEYPPGDDAMIIEAGRPCRYLYLVLEGTVHFHGACEDGGMRLVHSAFPGRVIGELSFLLGELPMHTAQADEKQRVRIAELNVERAVEVCEKDPQLARELFASLAAMLTHKLAESTRTLHSRALHDHWQDKWHDDHWHLRAADGSEDPHQPSPIDRPAIEVARQFGISSIVSSAEAEEVLLLGCSCRVSTEISGKETVGKGGRREDAAGAIFLFPHFLCVERTVLLFLTHRSRVALSDVLALLRLDDAPSLDAPSLDKSARPQLRTVEVQCRSFSISLAIAAERFESVCVAIENARIRSQNLETAGAEGSADVKTISPEAPRGHDAPVEDWSAASDALKAPESQPSQPTADGKAGKQRPGERGRSDAPPSQRGAPPSQRGAPPSPALRKKKGGNGDETARQLRRSVSACSAASQAVHVPLDTRLQRVSHATISSLAAAVGKGQHEVIERGGFVQRLGEMSVGEWTRLMDGATKVKLGEGDTLIREGEQTDGIFQVTRGCLLAEMAIPGRPQATVVGRLHSGDLLGESSLLNSTPAFASIIAAKGGADVLKFPRAWLDEFFGKEPTVAVKFYCLLATKQARQLRHISAERSAEIVIGGTAPKDIDSICTNAAFLLILRRYVATSERKDKVPLCDALDFLVEVKSLAIEPDPSKLRSAVRGLYGRYFERGAPHRLAVADDASSLQQAATSGAASTPPPVLRHLFDDVAKRCTVNVGRSCLSGFLSSPHYDYVLALKSKERLVLHMDHFKAVRELGHGAFGEVLLVIKRDCGHRYAMKVMNKEMIMNAFGPNRWKEDVLTERRLQGSLHHPLLVNLAYCFQNGEFLMMVMDACPGGDLGHFSKPLSEGGADALTSEQVRFVGLETAAVLSFLHSRHVLYRDLKPENLLLDHAGHVRLVDFGVALQGQRAPPLSMDVIGTYPYMAPEVRFACDRRVRYGQPADWFAFGVVLYELSEQALPFDVVPAFRDFDREYRIPELLDENGSYAYELDDLIGRLLCWEPEKRITSGKNGEGLRQLREHVYWRDADWELVETGRLPSPLRHLIEGRSAADEVKRQTRRRANPDKRTMRTMRARKAANDAERADKKKMSAGERWHVEGWDFVSAEFLAQEYVQHVSSTISSV